MPIQIVRVISEDKPLRKIDVLIAVEPPALLRLIEHLLEQPEFKVVARINDCPNLVPEAKRLQPALIVCNVDFLGRRAASVLSQLKLASPASKLIVISFVHQLGCLAHKWGADAYLEDEDLVRQLVPTARRLSATRTARVSKKRQPRPVSRTASKHRSSANPREKNQLG